MALEYLFFDESLAQQFLAVCRREGVEGEIERQTDGLMVRLAADTLPDETMDAVEAAYDELFFGRQADLVEAEDDGVAMSGIQIQLKSGEYTTVLIEPEIMNRLLSVFSIEELNRFMHEVAQAIEEPNGGGTVCEVMRRQKDGE